METHPEWHGGKVVYQGYPVYKNLRLKGASVMKITLDIPDGIVAGFFNGVEVTAHGMQLVSYQLSTDDLKDGNTVKLPREQEVAV